MGESNARPALECPGDQLPFSLGWEQQGAEKRVDQWKHSREQGKTAAAALGRRQRTLTPALQLCVTLDTLKPCSRQAMRTPTLRAR